MRKILLFLSYKWEDKDYANELQGLLNNPNNIYRHRTEREHQDLRAKGPNIWKNYMKFKIKNCDALVCLIGNDTHNATGVIYELEVATSLGIKIIPIRMPNTTGGLPKIIHNKKIINWKARELNNELSRK